MNLIFDLPIEIHVKILLECDLGTLGQLAKTCKPVNGILQTHSTIWTKLNIGMFPVFNFTFEQQCQFFPGLRDLSVISPSLTFFKFLKTTLTNETERLQITDASFDCRDCIVIPYGIVAKMFGFPWIGTPGILVYLRYRDSILLGSSKSNKKPETVSILNVLKTLTKQFELNPFSQIRCTFLGEVDSRVDKSFEPGEKLGNVSHAFPSFIQLRSIDSSNSSETLKLRIFTILKSPNKGDQNLYYSGMNRSLGVSMKFFTQLNSHYMTFFPVS